MLMLICLFTYIVIELLHEVYNKDSCIILFTHFQVSNFKNLIYFFFNNVSL